MGGMNPAAMLNDPAAMEQMQQMMQNPMFQQIMSDPNMIQQVLDPALRHCVSGGVSDSNRVAVC